MEDALAVGAPVNNLRVERIDDLRGSAQFADEPFLAAEDARQDMLSAEVYHTLEYSFLHPYQILDDSRYLSFTIFLSS